MPHTPNAFANCAKYALHPCERNEQIAALADEIAAATDAAPAVACWAATQELTAYDVLGGWDDPASHADRAQARVVLRQYRAAQAMKAAA